MSNEQRVILIGTRCSLFISINGIKKNIIAHAWRGHQN